MKVLEGGEVIDFLALPEGSLATNCCFGGPAYGSLFVTDAHHGRVYEFARMPTPGLPAILWTPVPDDERPP